jgi:hypothetical protein
MITTTQSMILIAALEVLKNAPSCVAFDFADNVHNIIVLFHMEDCDIDEELGDVCNECREKEDNETD